MATVTIEELEQLGDTPRSTPSIGVLGKVTVEDLDALGPSPKPAAPGIVQRLRGILPSTPLFPSVQPELVTPQAIEGIPVQAEEQPPAATSPNILTRIKSAAGQVAAGAAPPDVMSEPPEQIAPGLTRAARVMPSAIPSPPESLLPDTEGMSPEELLVRTGIAGQERQYKAGEMRERAAQASAQRAHPIPVRLIKDVLGGMLGTAEGMARGARWLTGIQAPEDFANAVAEIRKGHAPKNPNFWDNLASGGGSLLTFLVPGMAIARGTMAVASVSPWLASWIGGSAAATMEGMTEAGMAYKEAYDLSKDRKHAEQAANGNFWGNIGLIAVTNKLGIFGEKGKALRRALMSAVMEGSQEGVQEILQQIPGGKEISPWEIFESALVGSILGGGIGAMRPMVPRDPSAEVPSAELPPALLPQQLQAPTIAPEPPPAAQVAPPVETPKGAPVESTPLSPMESKWLSDKIDEATKGTPSQRASARQSLNLAGYVLEGGQWVSKPKSTPAPVAPQPGPVGEALPVRVSASVIDQIREKIVRNWGAPEGVVGQFTDQGLRRILELPDTIPISSLIQQGLVERTPTGHFGFTQEVIDATIKVVRPSAETVKLSPPAEVQPAPATEAGEGKTAPVSDELYRQAREVVQGQGEGVPITSALIQRRLKLGYSRASEILARMESEGIISPGTLPDGTPVARTLNITGKAAPVTGAPTESVLPAQGEYLDAKGGRWIITSKPISRTGEQPYVLAFPVNEGPTKERVLTQADIALKGLTPASPLGPAPAVATPPPALDWFKAAATRERREVPLTEKTPERVPVGKEPTLTERLRRGQKPKVAKEVEVLTKDGTSLGIMSPEDAQKLIESRPASGPGSRGELRIVPAKEAPQAGEGVTSQLVFGHPEATNLGGGKYSNLVPIKVRDLASVDHFQSRTQALVDELQTKIGTAEAIVKKRIPGDVKKAKAYLASANKVEEETVLDLLRNETIPELSRLAKEVSPKEAPREPTGAVTETGEGATPAVTEPTPIGRALGSVGQDSNLTSILRRTRGGKPRSGMSVEVGPEDSDVLSEMQETARAAIGGEATKVFDYSAEGQGGTPDVRKFKTMKPQWMQIGDTKDYYEIDETLKVLEGLRNGDWPTHNEKGQPTPKLERLASQIMEAARNDAESEKARIAGDKEWGKQHDARIEEEGKLDEAQYAKFAGEVEGLAREEEAAARPTPTEGALGTTGQREMFTGRETIGAAVTPGKKGTTVPQAATGDELLAGMRRPEPEKQTELPPPEAPVGKAAEEVSRQNVEEVRRQQTQATQAGHVRVGRAAQQAPDDLISPEAIRSDDPAIERALTSTARTGAPSFIDKIIEAYRAVRRGTTWEYDLKQAGLPLERDEIRTFRSARRRAYARAGEDVIGVIGAMKTPEELELFDRIGWLRNYREILQRPERYPGGVPEELTLEQVEGEIIRLEPMANVRVNRALQAEGRLMDAEFRDFIDRDLAVPEQKLPHYRPHVVLQYAKDRGWMPGTRRIKEPSRPYLKRAKGSAKGIETDWIKAMLEHRAHVRYSNAIDDFALEILERHDLGRDALPDDVRQNLRPGQTFTIGDVEYKAFQYRPGRAIFPVQTAPERAIAQAIANAVGDEVLIPVSELRQYGALGRWRKMHIVPRAIAERFENFGDEGAKDLLKVLNDATNRWKGVTIGFWGSAGNITNLLGDLANMTRQDTTAWLMLPRAVNLVLQWRSGRVSDLARLLEDYDVLSSGYVAGEAYFREHAPELQQFLTKAQKMQRLILDRTAGIIAGGALGTFAGGPTGGAIGAGVGAVAGLKGITRGIPEIREAIPRVAMAMAQLRRIERGKPLKGKGIDIAGLPAERAAMKIAREFTVDYGKFTPDEDRYLRGLSLPFYSWSSTNTPNWLRWMKAAPFTAAALLAARMALEAWNNSTDDKRRVEQSLPPYKRNDAHLVTGWRDAETGKMLVLTWRGDPFADMMGWLGLGETPARLADLATGRITLGKATMDQLFAFYREPGMKFVNLISPLVKVPFELASGVSTFTGYSIEGQGLRGTSEGTKRRALYGLESLFRPLREARTLREQAGKDEGFDWISNRWGLGLPVEWVSLEDADDRMKMKVYSEARLEFIEEKVYEFKQTDEYKNMAPKEQEVAIEEKARWAASRYQGLHSFPVEKTRRRELRTGTTPLSTGWRERIGIRSSSQPSAP